MALYPALPLFTDAYLADTRHLTTEEHGAYLLLLMCAWRSDGCQLEDNDKTLARIAGLSPTRWRRIKPAMVKFFSVQQGYWQQKKLQAVYGDVASRVARNKANGARGGRARAANSTKRVNEIKKPEETYGHDAKASGKRASKPAASNQATKAKPKAKKKRPPAAGLADQKKSGENFAGGDFDVAVWRAQIAAACAEGTLLDDAVIHFWNAAGVDLRQDAIPTIVAVCQREVARTGRVPRSLGYYRDAVLEASAVRQNAEQGGLSMKAPPKVALAQKRTFDPANTDDWKEMLGDPASRFRGDQMARNWFIPNDHPLFKPRGLGANPRLCKTSHIPEPVRDLYGSAWMWL